MKKFLSCLMSFPLLSAALEEETEQVVTQSTRCHSGGFDKEWIGVQFFGSALFWQTEVDGTEYIYDLVRGKKERTESQRFDWGVGYRVGAGLRLPLVRWKIIGTYTHFCTQDHDGSGFAPPPLFFLLQGKAAPSTQEARSDYTLDYDNFEFNLYRSSFFGRLLGLETAVGVKKTWIDQRQEAIYLTPSNTRVKDRCWFGGAGPMFGINLRWPLCYGISFLADGQGSLLFGTVEVKQIEKEVALKGASHTFIPTLHLFLGLQWHFPMTWLRFNVGLGYEAEHFFRQKQSIKIGNNSASDVRIQFIRYAEDLTFYGGTLKAGIEF